MSDFRSTITFQYVSDQKYACRDCPARCCRYPWIISVTQAEYDRYHSTPWIKARLEEAETDLTPVGKGRYTMPRVALPQGGKGCIFLDEANLCAMQKKEGHGFIPATCQHYPFRFSADAVRQAEGTTQLTVYPVVSYFCPSILTRYGEPFETVIPHKYDQQYSNQLPPLLPESFTLGGMSLVKNDFLMLLDSLKRVFQRPDLSLSQAFILGRHSMRQLTQDEAWQPLTSRANLRAVLDALETAPPTPQAKNLPRHNITAQVLSSMAILPSVSDLTDAQSEAEKQHLLSVGSITNRILLPRIFLGLIRNRGIFQFWDFPKPVAIRDAVNLSLAPPASALSSALKQYYVGVLQNKKGFIDGNDFLQAYWNLAVSYPTILRLARYHALAHDRQTVTLNDLQSSIGLVDVMVTSQSREPINWFQRMRHTLYKSLSGQPGAFYRLVHSEPFI